MIDARAKKARVEGGDAQRCCTDDASIYARGWQRMMGLVDTGNVRTRVRFQGWTGPGGCCARVRINLRLLVKIRALSFHLCADWFARLATSNVCVSGPRLRMCWCWDIYMRRRRGRRSGTPVDFLPKEREKERATLGTFSRFIYFGTKEGNPATQSVPFLLRILILLTTRVIFLERKTMFEFWQVEFQQFPNGVVLDFLHEKERRADSLENTFRLFSRKGFLLN